MNMVAALLLVFLGFIPGFMCGYRITIDREEDNHD